MLNRVPFSVRPALFFGLILFTYYVLADPSRKLEARAVASIGSVFSDRIVGLGESASVLVRANEGLFAAELTRGCSAAVSAAVLLGIGILFTTGRLRDRWSSSLKAIFFVFGLNLIRIVLVMAFGAAKGPEALAISHDLIGTTISYLALAAGLALLVRDSIHRQDPSDPLLDWNFPDD